MAADPDALGATVAVGAELEDRRRVVSAAVRHGASIAELVDSTLLASVAATGTPRDHARRAARLALAMQAVSPTMRVVLCTGRKAGGAAGAVGEVIDRGAALLRAEVRRSAGPGGEVAARGAESGSARGIRVDEVTAALLGAGFDVRLDEVGWSLLAEAAPGQGATARKPCFGRDRELGTLGALAAECIEEPVARAAILVGPPGIGKSSVLEEALARLPGEARTFRAETDADSAGVPFGVLGRLLRSAAGLSGTEAAETQYARIAALVGRYGKAAEAGRVLAGMAALAGSGVGAAHAAGAATVAAGAIDAEAMRKSFEAFIHAATLAHPLVLAVEDLQWADVPSLRAIDSALRRHQSSDAAPLLVLGTARPEIESMYANLWTERAVQVLRLGDIGPRAALRLVRARLGPDADPALVEQVLAQGGGHAFFLEELARAAAEGRSDFVPESVVGMVGARLAAFEGEDRRILRAASVFGQRFPVAGVEALLGAGAAPRARLEALVEREVLRVDNDLAAADGPATFAFAHALVREAAYAMLTDEDRRLGHRLAGLWLETRGAGEPLLLAHHFERGGELGRALDGYERAARDSLAAADLELALELADRAMALGPVGEAKGRMLAIAAEALQLLGDLDAAHARATVALPLLPTGTPDWYRASRAALARGMTLTVRPWMR
jgi:hypothetical protein